MVTELDLARWELAKFMVKPSTEVFFSVVVVANAIFIGVQEDYSLYPHPDPEPMWRIVDICFLSVFVLELILKLVGFGQVFFYDNWNNYDGFIILAAVIEAYKSPH